jgi:hypothetical protein
MIIYTSLIEWFNFFVGAGGDGGSTSGSTVGIIVGSVIGGIILIILCSICLGCSIRIYRQSLRGRPVRSNSSYINSGVAMQYDMSKSVFISGTFESYYYQYNKYHGPSNLQLAFYPEAGYIVHGGGVDDIGTYIITGIYSPRTLRMGLEKRYQIGTGNPSENLGHIVTIQVEWNFPNKQFQGKYYLRTSKHRDENLFIIRFQHPKHSRPYTIQSPV